jgi:hypothetical protein
MAVCCATKVEGQGENKGRAQGSVLGTQLLTRDTHMTAFKTSHV